MANQFRAAWTVVDATKRALVSKSGNDASTTPANGETPYATWGAGFAFLASNGTAISEVFIGTGVYKESVAASAGGVGIIRNVRANGKVILRGTGTGGITVTGSGGNLKFYGIEFQNMVIHNGAGSSFDYYGCTFKGCTFTGARHNFYEGCLLDASSSSVNAINFRSTTLVNNCVFSGNATVLENCIIDVTSRVNVANGAIGGNNCVDGLIKSNVANSVYTDIDSFLAFHASLYPTLMEGSFKADPLFSNYELGVYSLRKSSPCVGRAQVGTGVVNINLFPNIGGQQIGVAFAIDRADPDNAFSDLNPLVAITGGILWNGNNATSVNTDVANDYWRSSGWMAVDGGRLAEIPGGAPVGNLEFNKSFGAPSIDNMNVPDTTPSAGLTDGSNNPDRLTFLAKTSNLITKPTTADGDNNGFWPANEWRPFFYFEPFYVWKNPANPALFKTNGELDFPWADTANIFTLSARYIRVKERFGNDNN